jgi:peptide/nickel transport system permease protein
MTLLILRRAAASLVLLWLVLTLTFSLVHLAPGDPIQLLDDPRMPPRQRAHLREVYGLDRPPLEQYLGWLRAVVLDLDWGSSFVHGRPVSAVLAEALPATLLLAASALLLLYAGGLLLGVLAACHPRGLVDHLIRAGSLLVYSLPVFWLGLMAILLLSLRWPLFPAGHLRSVDAASLPPLARLLDLVSHLALPSLVLAAAAMGGVARFVRNSLLEVLGQDFIRSARARGLSAGRVVWVHGLRNAAGPLIQLFGLHFPFLLSGSVVVEVVFAWPGVGRLTYDAILARDYPIVLAATALTAAMVVAGNLLADLLHAWADPRLRRPGTA